MVFILSTIPKVFENNDGMEITINNQTKSLAAVESISLRQLLDLEIPEKQKGIAVAVNNQVIPRSGWKTKIISPNDSVLIIKATQGG